MIMIILLAISGLLAIVASLLRGRGEIIDRPGREPEYLRSFQHTGFRSSRIAL